VRGPPADRGPTAGHATGYPCGVLLFLACAGPAPAPAEPPPIVVVILGDDLGANMTWAMPRVQASLVPDARVFSRAYAGVPLCCPARASLLSGGWSPNETGVYGNAWPSGGVRPFQDEHTLATRMRDAGFATAHLGKYLNGYETDMAPAIPPGWDEFVAPVYLGDFTNSRMVRGVSGEEGAEVGTGGEHMTAWLFAEALAFLDAHPDEPVFLYLAPYSPHLYGEPAVEDLGTYADYTPRPANWAEADVSDKPDWIQREGIPEDTSGWDDDARQMLENLQSFDRGVGALLDGIASRDLKARTTVILTGDSGHLNGEHRLVGKGVPYEESIAVPLFVRGPGVTPGEDDRLVSVLLDVPATVSALAGIDPEGEGIDPLGGETREAVIVETAFGTVPEWVGVVTERWKYVEWAPGDVELYDRSNDAYELVNLAGEPPAEADMSALAARVEAARPLNIIDNTVPPAQLGVPFVGGLTAWGGEGALTWSLAEGVLPDGLELTTAGHIAGTPTEEGTFAVVIAVTDAGTSALTGLPHRFAADVTVTVLAPEAVAREPQVHRSGDVVSVEVPARPGARVGLRAWTDATHDLPAIMAEDVLATGWTAEVALALDPRRSWHWSATIDGIVAFEGALPRK
jgi:N-acetylglucosamine-6-sulfatase